MYLQTESWMGKGKGKQQEFPTSKKNDFLQQNKEHHNLQVHLNE
jgi:hypothetical protein